jgi:transposase-like protein
VLDKLPKRLQPAAKDKLNDIWQADTREHASQAFDLFLETYSAKYPKATECLSKDREVLLAFYDFPAEHWIHLRTTNPIESTFATVRHRHRKTKGNGSRVACLAMVFKLVQAAEKKWRLLHGSEIIPDCIAACDSSMAYEKTKWLPELSAGVPVPLSVPTRARGTP